jgi:hypothetical protein
MSDVTRIDIRSTDLPEDARPGIFAPPNSFA